MCELAHLTHDPARAQLVINEVSESSAQALQAVKLLAQYLGDKVDKVEGPPRCCTPYQLCAKECGAAAYASTVRDRLS